MIIRLGVLLVIKGMVQRDASAVEINILECGVDERNTVQLGDVPLHEYPWLGVLYYEYDADRGHNRAVTTVALIQAEFVIAPAADIGPMPKDDFTERTRVVLGHGWERAGRRVRSYVIHPEYERSRHTVALVQLADAIRTPQLRPICPPPKRLRDPEFYIMRFDDDYETLRKEVIVADYVPSLMCKKFYQETKLYAKSMRPPYVACAISLAHKSYCLWESSGVLATRDVWGRWQLLGLGVRGPGCSAPSRYMDIASYLPWIEQSLARYQLITVSRINPHKYVLRSDYHYMQRFGDCNTEEKKRILYRDRLILKKYSSSPLFQSMQYNMTLRQAVRFTCLTMELINASSKSEIVVRHTCPKSRKQSCYEFRDSVFDISVFLIFGKSCVFELTAFGYPISMELIDKQVWKWEEGSYYPDFSLERTEYRGTAQETGFGFEQLNEQMWVPLYDVWTTTEKSNVTSPPPPPTDTPKKYRNFEEEYAALQQYDLYNKWWKKLQAMSYGKDNQKIEPSPTKPNPTTTTKTTTTTSTTTLKPVTTVNTTRSTTTTTKKKIQRKTTTRTTTVKIKTTTTTEPPTIPTTPTPPPTTHGRWYG